MFAACSLAFVVGVCMLQQMPKLPDLAWACLVFLPLCAILIGWRFHHSLLKHAGLLVFSMLCGFFWANLFAQHRMAEALPKDWEAKKITLIGVVASMPQALEKAQRFEFDVEQVLTDGAIVPRHISLTQYQRASFTTDQFDQQNLTAPKPNSVQQIDFHAGQRWQLSVKLKRPHGLANPHGFDFESWALERDIRATGYIQKGSSNQLLSPSVNCAQYLVERLREQVRADMQTTLQAKPYAGVLVALVTGDEASISTTDWQLFQRTGTTHLMSISGLHITMLSGLVAALVYALWRRSSYLVTRFPAKKAAVMAGLLLALAYTVFSGFSVPAQRTFYMLAVVVLAVFMGRQFGFFQILAAALLVVVAIDTWAVLSAGFWLSFGAVGIMVYAMSGRLGRMHWLKEAAYSQCVVTLGCLPLLLIFFQQVSIVSPLANAIAIPLVSLMVTPLALIGGLCSIEMCLQFSHWLMTECMLYLNWLAAMPVVVWQQKAPALWQMLIALVGVIWVLLPKGFPLRWLGLYAILPMLLVSAEPIAFGAMQMAVLDVGQGLSVLVKTQHHQLLYDAGPKYSSQSDSGSRVILPYLRAEGVKALDGFIVSHHDNDHSGGMASVLSGLPVTWFASSFNDAGVAEHGAKVLKCFAGQSWLWDGVRFEILHPDFSSYDSGSVKDNNRSCVLKITSKNGSALLTGDIESEAEGLLLGRYDQSTLASDVLVVPHHGSKTSSTQAFIDTVNPAVAIFTMGYRNRFGHPKAEVVQRYQQRNATIYRSDEDGAVLIGFENHQQIAISAWRKQFQRYWQDKHSL